MKQKSPLLSFTILLFLVLSSCAKTETPPANNPTPTPNAFIQIDDKKSDPVTQKNDPYKRGQVNSCFFGSTTLDLSTKTGSNSAIIQTILEYKVPDKSMAEGDVLAKTLFDGLEEGKTIKAKILGEDSRYVTPITGFILSGSVSAGTGVWDYMYNEKGDVDMDITKVNGKIQFTVSTPISITLPKRGGAGDPNYPGFNATTMFSLLMPR